MNEAVVPKSARNRGTAELVADAFARRSAARGPKFLCLYSALKELVEDGTLRPGVQLPPDDEIARRLGLSLGTIQKAMAALRDDRILDRRHGAGTFVVDPSIDMHDVWHFRFLADDGQSFLPLKARVLKRSVLRKRGPWQQHMPGVESFVTVTRIINVNGEFNLLSDFHFDGKRFADLAHEPVKQFQRVVLRNLLTERYGVRTKNARQLLTCERLSTRDCRILKCGPDSIGMILETFGTDQSDSPIYYQRVVIPRNRRKLALDGKA